MKLSFNKQGGYRSDKIGKSNKKKREPISKIFMRIIAFILVLLMLSGSLYYVFQFLFVGVFAQQYEQDLLIRVGLMYGNGVTVGFETAAKHGFSLGYVDSQNKYTALTQVTDTALSVTCDTNLSNTNRTFAKTDSPSPSVGGYHIEISAADLFQYYEFISALLYSQGITAFPAYINGEYKIRAGSYASADAVKAVIQSFPDQLIQTLASLAASVSAASPSTTALSVVNPYTNAIVFEFDSADLSAGLGMEALKLSGADTDTAYLVTPAKNEYEGVFEFRRNLSSYIDGVALTNILTLEQYTLGVLPHEIGSGWPIESQKAFAVAVRSFVLSHLGKHSRAYGFDVCNGTDCQVYRGVGTANNNVRQAVSATAGQVLVYNGKIASTFFSSSTGGTTVSAADAWGSNPANYPYLSAKATPWEQYAEHTYGEWTSEVSPTELYNTLRAKGYTLLRGPISDIKINSTAQNSTYVTSITFTDIYGTPVNITKSDTIRTVLSAHVRSANFQVAPAGQTVILTDYFYKDAVDVFGVAGKQADFSEALQNTYNEQNPAFMLPTNSELNSSLGLAIKLITSSGTASAVKGNLTAVNSSGIGLLNTAGGYITAQTSSGQRNFILPDPSELGMPDGQKNESGSTYNPFLPPQLSTLTVSSSSRYIIAEGSPGSFVFVGRGYGHGVGMSQWGVYDLARLGYGYVDILKAYYTGTEIIDYRFTGAFAN